MWHAQPHVACPVACGMRMRPRLTAAGSTCMHATAAGCRALRPLSMLGAAVCRGKHDWLTGDAWGICVERGARLVQG
eukprot:359853-Chlamydomonas_euryale.AAC.11